MALVIMRKSEIEDMGFILENDNHIRYEVLEQKIKLQQSYTIWCGSTPCGFLRYSFFGDSIPILNTIFLLEEYRKKGFGRISLASWERKMQLDAYEKVLTSSLSIDDIQHFYRKNGYQDCGSLMLENESLEIVFKKKI